MGETREREGLELENLLLPNKALLVKWLWRFALEPNPCGKDYCE